MEENIQLLDFKMRLLQAEIKLNSMKAENKLCEQKQQFLKYKEQDFLNIIEEYGIHHNNLYSLNQ